MAGVPTRVAAVRRLVGRFKRLDASDSVPLTKQQSIRSR
jgi:hypothetical protein